MVITLLNCSCSSKDLPSLHQLETVLKDYFGRSHLNYSYAFKKLLHEVGSLSDNIL